MSILFEIKVKNKYSKKPMKGSETAVTSNGNIHLVINIENIEKFKINRHPLTSIETDVLRKQVRSLYI